MAPFRCPECGAVNDEGRKWCRICGLHFVTRWLR
jgi:RNA polymerase subunit RPABC4/transcription elongation factor Spt4